MVLVGVAWAFYKQGETAKEEAKVERESYREDLRETVKVIASNEAALRHFEERLVEIGEDCRRRRE